MTAVYVKVAKGGGPVLGARVSVGVKIEPSVKSKEGTVELEAMEMLDDGYGGEICRVVKMYGRKTKRNIRTISFL